MKRANRILPILGGAIAGGAIALIVASGGGGTSSTTTTQGVAQSRNAPLPASFSPGKGLSVNQIYKTAAPGVVDITVSSQSQSNQFPFGGGGGGGGGGQA